MEKGAAIACREPRADLGVLLVHGIGAQKKGETLVAFGEPLVGWLERWLVARRSDARVDCGPARLTGDEPAHVEVQVPLPDTAVACRWLLAECWWAEEIRPPRFADVLVWAGEIAPAILIAHFLELARRAFDTTKDGGASRWRVRAFAGAFAVGARFALMVALLPLLVAVLVACLVVALLPLPFLRKAARVIQSAVSSFLGDSFLLVRSPFQRAALTARLASDLEWLRRRSRRVVVVAHSQGAAIAHLAAERPGSVLADVPILGLGSGTGKLGLIAALAAQRGRAVVSWLIVPSLLALAYGLYMSVGLVAELWIVVLGSVWWEALLRAALGIALLVSFWAVLALPVLGLLGVSLGPVAEVSPPQSRDHPGDREFWAAADPVPSVSPRARATRVENRRSALTDHTTYFDNLDELVGSLVGELVRWAGGAAAPEAEASSAASVFQLQVAAAVERARPRRARRVGALAAVRLLALAASLALLLSGGLPFGGIPRLSPAAEERLLALVGGVAEATTLNLALGLVAIWGVYAVAFALWRWWERQDLDAYFAGAPYARWPAAKIWFFFLPALVLELAVLQAAGVLTPWGVAVAALMAALMSAAAVKLILDTEQPGRRLGPASFLVAQGALLLLPTASLLLHLVTPWWSFLLAPPAAWILSSSVYLWVVRARWFPPPAAAPETGPV